MDTCNAYSGAETTQLGTNWATLSPSVVLYDASFCFGLE